MLSNRAPLILLSLTPLLLLHAGCAPRGPEPEVAEFVEVERYVGLWHEIASNPVFFNRNLVAVTAEYEVIEPGRISVLNKGRVGNPQGLERSISGSARVVDEETNAKLKVQFDTFWGSFFEGDYWIVLLDDEAYQYAVVTDPNQRSLFVLYREPVMPKQLYDEILDKLQARAINTSALRVTGELESAS